MEQGSSYDESSMMNFSKEEIKCTQSKLHEVIKNAATNQLDVIDIFLQELSKANKNHELLEETRKCIYTERKEIEKSLEIALEIFDTWRVLTPGDVIKLTAAFNDINVAGVKCQNVFNSYIRTIIIDNK